MTTWFILKGETNGDIADDDENQSRPSTPSSETSFRDLQLDSKVEQRSKVRELASAILQIEQSIDPKYLRRPLGKGKSHSSHLRWWLNTASLSENFGPRHLWEHGRMGFSRKKTVMVWAQPCVSPLSLSTNAHHQEILWG